MIVFSLVGSIVASSLVQTSADLGLGRHTAAVASEPGGTQRMVKTKILQVVGYRKCNTSQLPALLLIYV